MKNKMYWVACIIVLFVYVPSQAFSQNQRPNLLDSLPTNFEYQIHIDSFPYYALYRSTDINYFNNERTIGCFNTVEAQVAFALTISHPFLLDEYGDLIPASLILYAIKKSENLHDTTIVKALNDYCTYGQANYYFHSRDYVLFLYSAHTNSQAQVERLNHASFWNNFEIRLRKNLDSGCPIIAQSQMILPENNEFHKSSIVRGKYQLCFKGLPGQKIEPSIGTEIHISGTPDNCPFLVKLKRRNKAKAINIQNGKKQFRRNWKWYMDTHYVFINKRDGSGFYAYIMKDESKMFSLLNSEFGGEYWRKTK